MRGHGARWLETVGRTVRCTSSAGGRRAFLYGAADPAVEPGDFVFFRPVESDNLFLFEELHLPARSSTASNPGQGAK